MTDTQRIHPIKRVITFIMALLMISSAFIYFDFTSDAYAIQLYNANNWVGWYDAYVIDNNAYFGGIGEGGLAHLNATNPFSVNASGHFMVDVKDHNAGYDKAIIANSTGSTIPVGYKITVNINTSRGEAYPAVDNNNVQGDSLSMNYGSFSIAAMSNDVPDGTPMVNWAVAVTEGLARTSGVVLTFRSTGESKKTYDYVYVYQDGTAKHILKLSDLGLTVSCNGSSDTTFELRRQGTNSYGLYLTAGGKTSKLGDNLTIDDNKQLYYAVGSFPSGYGGGQGQRQVTDGSFTIKSVGCCANSAVTPSTFSGPQGHLYGWADYTTYKLYECVGCRLMSKKGITVTYNANGGILTGGSSTFHDKETTSTTASVPFTPSSDIVPSPPASKPGYEFAGWSTNPSATEPDTSFSSTSNIAIHAIYKKSTYKLTFDPNGGKFEDNTTANKVYNIQYGDLYQTKVGDMPNPTKRGYSFVGWDVNGSTYYAPDWASNAAYNATESLTFTARWSAIQGYTLTFDAKGGSMPSGYNSTYLFYPNEKFQDIIGGFPVPIRSGHRFLGWQNSEYAADVWEDGWGTQPYTFGKNITLNALWEEIPGYILTLDAGKGTFTATTSHTAQYTVAPGEKLVDNNVPFAVPVRTGYTFLGWQWENRTDHFWTDGWGTQPYYWTEDVTFNAVWQLDHVHDVNLKENVRFDIGGGVYRDYDKVVCKICGDELYGFKCMFYSRNSGVVNFNAGTKLLNQDVLLTDVFVNPVASKCNTWVLSEEPLLTLQLKFDPTIRGINSAGYDLFLGWTSGAPSVYNRGLNYTAKDGYLSMICSDNYFAYYEANAYEYLFDATYNMQYLSVYNSATQQYQIDVNLAKLAQENRNYGIAVVPYMGYFDDYIDYLPAMKAVHNAKLLATNTWYYKDFGLNYVSIHNYSNEAFDKVLIPGTRTGNTGAEAGAPEGRLNTYYANNKGAKYVEAHYDPNYRYSGTMYYRYEKNSKGEVIMTPDFTFDPRRDNSEDNIGVYYDESLGAHPLFLARDHDQYHAEFDWSAYFEDKDPGSAVIIKDPRMYTTYLGDADPYKFINIVAEPHGDVYRSMGQNDDGSYNIEDTDPDIRRHEVYVKALHSNVYKGDSYIVYKKEATIDGVTHQLPDYRLGRDYSEQYNEFTSRNPLYYAYNYDHDFSDYGVTNYDNRFPTLYGRGTLTDRGFEPISGTYEPLWAYGDGGWNSFDVIPGEPYRENWGGFSQILQYPGPDNTLLAAGIDLYQYSAYQQWDNKIQFNANVNASYLNNAADYGGYNEVYLYTVSYGNFYMPDANLFTRDRYVIVGWATSQDRANQGIVDFDCGKTIAPSELCKYTLKDGTTFSFTNFAVNSDGTTVAPTLYAVWKHVVNYTLEEGETGYGSNPFATVTYKDARTNESKTVGFNETMTVKTFAQSKITVNVGPGATGYEYSYMTINQNNAPLNADRILTTDVNYTFTIFDDTAMTAQFVPASSAASFYVDRNNKLLRNSADAWRLYTQAPTRTPAGVADDTVLDNALYYTYKDNTGTYSITVSGSTYAAMNGQHSNIPYDDVITLMTGPENSSGNKFVGWQIGSAFVSFDLVYKHRVTSTETVIAVYSGEAVPTISIVHSDTESRKFFVAQRTAPEGYTLLETGFIITKENDTSITFGDLYDANGAYNSKYYKIVSTDTDKDGTFKVLLSSGTYKGIAYAYYLDPSDKIVSCVTPTFPE